MERPRKADYCPVYGSVYSGLKPQDIEVSTLSVRDHGLIQLRRAGHMCLRLVDADSDEERPSSLL